MALVLQLKCRCFSQPPLIVPIFLLPEFTQLFGFAWWIAFVVILFVFRFRIFLSKERMQRHSTYTISTSNWAFSSQIGYYKVNLVLSRSN